MSNVNPSLFSRSLSSQHYCPEATQANHSPAQQDGAKMGTLGRICYLIYFNLGFFFKGRLVHNLNTGQVWECGNKICFFVHCGVHCSALSHQQKFDTAGCNAILSH
jgi:hypothetical protein